MIQRNTRTQRSPLTNVNTGHAKLVDHLGRVRLGTCASNPKSARRTIRPCEKKCSPMVAMIEVCIKVNTVSSVVHRRVRNPSLTSGSASRISSTASLGVRGRCRRHLAAQFRSDSSPAWQDSQRDFVSGTARDPSRIERARREAPPRWTHLAKRLVLESLGRDGRDREVLQPFELSRDLFGQSQGVHASWEGGASARLGRRTIARVVSDLGARGLYGRDSATRLVVGKHPGDLSASAFESGSSETKGEVNLGPVRALAETLARSLSLSLRLGRGELDGTVS